MPIIQITGDAVIPHGGAAQVERRIGEPSA
jgi:hypothetical protein